VTVITYYITVIIHLPYYIILILLHLITTKRVTSFADFISVAYSGVARGASGDTRPGAQALGAQQHTFCSHFKRVFK